MPFFANFTMLSMQFPITNSLPFFFQADEILSDDLVTHCRQRSERITNKKQNQMTSEIKLLERTKVYYCFNSKGDNFNHVSQLKMLPKTKHTSKTQCLAVFLMGKRWLLNYNAAYSKPFNLRFCEKRLILCL